jgi:hypothetical protein
MDPDESSSERKEEDEGYIFKVIKYSCYPLYLSVGISGRPRYFMDYLILGMLGCTMFFLSNSIAAFSMYLPGNRGLVSLLYSCALVYPSASYFLRVSGGANDYDFLGIFMQGVIFKLTVFSLGLAVTALGICGVMQRGAGR